MIPRVRPNCRLAMVLGVFASAALAGAEMERIESLESLQFDPERAVLRVGRDGRVCLASPKELEQGYVLLMAPDGSNRSGRELGASLHMVTSNARGELGACHHSWQNSGLATYDASGEPVAKSSGKYTQVEAGEASGDFYFRRESEIARVAPDGQEVHAYTPPGALWGQKPAAFRVHEGSEAFFILAQDRKIHCVGFDGAERWSVPAPFNLHAVLARCALDLPFDLSSDGTLYVYDAKSCAVQVYASGNEIGGPEALGSVKLPAEQLGPSPGAEKQGVLQLAVAGSDILIRRRLRTEPGELFQRYELKSGKLLQTVCSQTLRLKAEYTENVWQAGQSVPFTIRAMLGANACAPRWRVYAAPFGSTAWREFPWSNDRLELPADASGLYRLRVTASIAPRPFFTVGKDMPADLTLEGAVEIRPPQSNGSISVYTPANREAYARGESIPFKVLVRAADPKPRKASVVLQAGAQTLHSWSLDARPGEAAALELSSAFTRVLAPGRYVLSARAEGLAPSDQCLWIGPGPSRPTFRTLDYQDYGAFQDRKSAAHLWNSADAAAEEAAEQRRLGRSLLIQRLGVPPTSGDPFVWKPDHLALLDGLRQRLAADPLAAAPEKADLAPPLAQALSQLGAQGVEHMSILMNNDAGLPLGTGYDKRKPEELLAQLKAVTAYVKEFPAFRGWTWAANWWVFAKRGAKAGRTPEEQAAYKAALERAQTTGAWDPVLDTVCDVRLSFAVEAQDLFNAALRELAPKAVTAVSGPFRNVECYPPVTFNNVDEVDLQAQFEQISLPYHAAFAVDFYKRPGKDVLSHPELGNDLGTGDQFLPNSFMSIARGSNSSGFASGYGYREPDPRTNQGGCPSIQRAFFPLMESLGPWLATLRDDDRVAIVASARMLKTDKWHRLTGLHFGRLFEAWVSCMFAHHPARIVFAEDASADLLARFKAILVVDQRFELEPALAGALKAAQAKGVKILHDSGCLESAVKGFTPLGFAFNRFENDPSPAADDAAYWRMPQWAKEHAHALRKALAGAVEPIAELDAPDVWVTARAAGDARFLYVVNHTHPPLPPEQLWRMSLYLTHRLPLTIPLRTDTQGRAVYELFAQGQMPAENGTLQADLRGVPGRIFALLPKPVGGVLLRGPERARAGQAIAWSAHARGEDGEPLNASLPLLLRLLDGNGRTIEERPAVSGQMDAQGEFTIPWGFEGASVTLEALERFSGKASRLVIAVEPAAGAFTELPAAAAARDGSPDASPRPAPETAFGPHLRDVAVSRDGATVLINAFNWDRNAYLIDAATGATKTQVRLGHYFAFEPQVLERGFAVRGFDFQSPEGYHLYLLGSDGAAERRFALPAYPKRLPWRHLPTLLRDRIDNFATAPDGSWVAAAGDLGLAVWSRDGALLWSQEWWKTERRDVRLFAPDAKHLYVIGASKLESYEASSGKPLHPPLDLGGVGEVTEVISNPDGRTLALGAPGNGGQILVLRDRQIILRYPSPFSELALSPDGTALAVTRMDSLQWVGIDQGLRWTYRGDAPLRAPRFSPDGVRLACATDLGTLCVMEREGRVLLERDLGALCVPAWLPDGDLVLASWMGSVQRLDGEYRPRWTMNLKPDTIDLRTRLLEPDSTPTARIETWTNAAPSNADLTPNLLAAHPVTVKSSWGKPLNHEPELLWDGKADPASDPWVDYSILSHLAKSGPPPHITLAFNQDKVRVTGIALFEDPAHPASWLRDCSIEVWDLEKNIWVRVQDCLSNAARHTHLFAKPVETNQIRLVLPSLSCGNVRLTELVLLGERVGPYAPPGKKPKKRGKNAP
ncbi:MAG: WD40 repeat domain-containing protein [Planctomycetes bacterium]|nr:WD40 repeat domain-containing protein [Planctomycetota bacterium]